ncbi:MAG: hypothetical protein V1746_00705 [bacterium]
MGDVVHQIIVSYEGTAFRGWQRQGKLPTVQLELENAVARCWGKACTVHGSGRTDTGVHALAQAAHFCAPRKFDAATVVRALNDHLPPAVRVLKARFMPDSCHSRFPRRVRSNVIAFLIMPFFRLLRSTARGMFRARWTSRLCAPPRGI